MKRPDKNPGITKCVVTPCGNMYVTDCTGGEYKEIFVILGKPGSCSAAMLQAIARLASKGMRQILTKEDVIKMCIGIQCGMPKRVSGGVEVLSCPDAIAKALENKAEIPEFEK